MTSSKQEDDKGKIVTARQAAERIGDGQTVWLVAGGGGINEPSLLLKEIEACFLDTGHPKNLTLCHSAGIGDKQGGGVDRFAHEGMVRKVIGRDAIVNLGFGMPAGVASVMHEEGMDDHMTLSVEQGITGGIPSSGSNFGLVYDPQVIVDAPSQFDWYDGGGLDVAILSFAEFDQYGNVNVSKFGERVNGVGGFINISQAARKVVFVGTMKTGGFEMQCRDGKCRIVREGRVRKAVEHVAQISFSGSLARKQGQKVLFITERAVLELTPEGMVLTEIAEGVDLDRDVLGQMGFAPIISNNLTTMPANLFKEKVIV